MALPPPPSRSLQSTMNLGLCSALIKRYQEISIRDQVPIWLEATTEYSRNLYTTLGFETVEEITLGKGKVGTDGTNLKGGAGVKIWAMIWRPKY